MAFIEPCEVEELLGSCCTCTETTQGDDDGSGGDTEPNDCGVAWGRACEEDGDCAGSFCCRDMLNDAYTFLPPSALGGCLGSGSCKRCWDCDGEVGFSFDDPSADTCNSGPEVSQSNCTHGYACYWCYEGECDQVHCLPWDAFCVLDDDNQCGDNYWPNYYECYDSPHICEYQGWSGHRLLDTTIGACCQHEWVDSSWVYIGCEEVMYNECKFGPWWGINTTCGGFEDCCGFVPNECEVDSDCEEDNCCSDFGNCVTCASCDCQCLDSISAWECCEETDGDGIWHSGETCESYDCEEDCPEEPECGPDAPCPPCYSCNSGVCEPECQESSDCSSGRCCSFGCCIECVDECSNDGNCDGDKCCVNGSCTYDCPPEPECDGQTPCPGEQECEDGICVDPPDCGDDDDCSQAKCCEDGECVSCDPEPPDCEGEIGCACLGDDDCGEYGEGGLCCLMGFCFPCGNDDVCYCEQDGPMQRCGLVECGIDDNCEPDDDGGFGQCVILCCCCDNESDCHQYCH